MGVHDPVLMWLSRQSVVSYEVDATKGEKVWARFPDEDRLIHMKA